jgi:hypothetical protein
MAGEAKCFRAPRAHEDISMMRSRDFMKHWSIMFMLLAGIAVVGCEDRAIPPGDYDIDSPAEAEPARPTAEELLQGPREPLRLGALPLTLEVPQSWEIWTLRAGLVFLQGPTPSGDVQIQLSSRPILTPEQLELRYAGAQAEAAENPNVRRVDMRLVNDLTVLERLVVEPLPEDAVAAEDGDPPVLLGTPLRWTIGVYVRSGAHFEVYELNFIGLTVEQYEQDEEFLRPIVETIRLDSEAPAPQPPA